MVAIKGYGNYDSVSWEQVGEILDKGQTVYDHTTRYNTSPLWFWILGWIRKVSAVIPLISFRSWIRIFLSLVDLCAAAILWRYANAWKAPRVTVLTLFYLNPVSILLSAYHAQFENLAILFLLIGLGVYAGREPISRRQKLGAWCWVTLGMIAKHNICYEVPIVLRFMYGKFRNWFLLFVLSCAAFFAIFLPYWQASHASIVKNVWLYGSYPMSYGISTFLTWGPLKFIFLAALLGYTFVQRSNDIVIRCLQGMLFFLTFTPGFGHQYLALPVAVGAIRPSRGYVAYTVAATLAIMGSDRNIHIKALSWVPLNAVWLCAAMWFISIHAQPSQSSGFLGGPVHETKKNGGSDKINQI